MALARKVKIDKNVVDAVAVCSYVVECLMKALQIISFPS